MDLFRRQEEGGHRDRVGVYGAIGWAETGVDHFDGTKAGTDHLTGYTAGGYWTHFGPRGWYVDGVLQGTWYDAEANSKSGQFDLHTDGFGIAASLEGRYPFRLARVWVIEPQAQLIYQWIELDDARDPAAEVRFRDVESLVGRVGVRLARTWELGEPDNLRRLTAWVRPSVWYEFLGDPKTQFSSATGFRSFRADFGGGWFEIKGGVTGQVARHVALYGSVGYSVGFDDNRHAGTARSGCGCTGEPSPRSITTQDYGPWQRHRYGRSGSPRRHVGRRRCSEVRVVDGRRDLPSRACAGAVRRGARRTAGSPDAPFRELRARLS